VLFGFVGITAFVVVAFILGFLLFVRRRLEGTARRARLPFLLYFACLGAGFIVVEVVLVQKCVLFLGHPAYALTVVLFALPPLSGLGSRAAVARGLARALAAPGDRGRAALVMPACPPVAAFLRARAPRRSVAGPDLIAALAPLGLALGMPMPTGSGSSTSGPRAHPLGVGVNGAASMLGSVGAVTLAIIAGFNVALLTKTAFYLVTLKVVLQATSIPAEAA
jgi:hypothetical protein